MTQATVRTAVYNAVNGVTDIGKVYDYERFVDSWDTFLNLFKFENEVRGWMVSYNGFEAVIDDICDVIHEHHFIVRGFLRFDDSAASEKTMAALTETVCNTIDADSTVKAHIDVRPATVPVFEARIFGSALCHYTEVHVFISEAVSR